MAETKEILLPEIDLDLAQQEIEDFIIEKVTEAGACGGVVGLSGGIDSSTVAYLAASAFRRHAESDADADRFQLLGAILPAGISSPDDEQDARTIIEALEIEVRTVQIQPMVESFKNGLATEVENKRHLGNLMSEVRAITLSRLAAARNALILGTGNKDEDYCLGYFTKRGDGAVDISPVGSLSKRNVRRMARHLGVPAQIVDRVPTAGLWHGQTDENELGFTYELAELVLAGQDQGLSASEIADATGAPAGKVNSVLSRHHSNKHKMTMPDIAPVSYTNNTEIEEAHNG